MSNKKNKRVYIKGSELDVMYNKYRDAEGWYWFTKRKGSFYIHRKIEGEDMQQVTLEMFNKLSGKVTTLTKNLNSFVKEQREFNKRQDKRWEMQEQFNNQVFKFMQRQDDFKKQTFKRLDNIDNRLDDIENRLDNIDKRLDNIVVKNNLTE